MSNNELGMRSVVDEARGAFAHGAWREACDALLAAAGAGPLAGEDLERLAVAACLVGEDDVCAHGWEDAHRSALAGRQQAGGKGTQMTLTLPTP